LADAQMLIGHAGAGTIALALKYRKPLLVVPRLQKFKEHVNDHQVVTARKYEALGYVLVAYDMQDIPAKLAELKKFKPRRREAHPQNLARRIGEYLGTLLPAEPVDAKNAQAPSTSAMRERTTGACKPDDFRGASAKDGSRNRHTAPAHAPD
jgi:predicted glycosyltransferase